MMGLMNDARHPLTKPDVHLPALDGVRGIAVGLVMWYHTTLWNLPSTAGFDHVWSKIAKSGWIGVDLFFVLSGFLITGILIDSRGSRHFLRNFYGRRALRIFPLAYAYIALFVLVLPFVVPHLGPAFAAFNDSLKDPVQHQVWLWTYLCNFYMAFNGGWVLGSPGIMWSLAIEEHFYIVWPLVVLLVKPMHLAKACVAVMLFSVLVRLACIAFGVGWLDGSIKGWWTDGPPIAGQPTVWWFCYVLTPARLDGLALGGLLAVMQRGEGGLQRYTSAFRWLALACAVVLVVMCQVRPGEFHTFTLHRQDHWVQGVGFAFLGVIFGALVLYAAIAPTGSRLAKCVASRPLVFLGKYSYALYLFHWPVRVVVEKLFEKKLPMASFPRVYDSLVLWQVLFYLATWTVSILLALVSWHLFEKHFLKLKKLFPR
jgi:peptidoglycan/LPS O-acetylase OafA/YrhL